MEVLCSEWRCCAGNGGVVRRNLQFKERAQFAPVSQCCHLSNRLVANRLNFFGRGKSVAHRCPKLNGN